MTTTTTTTITTVDLPHKVTITIPSTVDGATPCDPRQTVERIARAFSRALGGATIREARGAWASPVHGLVLEDVVEIEGYCGDDCLERAEVLVKSEARAILHDLAQEAVLYTVNGKGHLICA